MEEWTEEHEQELAAFLKELAEGKTCPHCHAPIEKKVQVQRSIYLEPCGCRLGTGTLPKKKKT